MRELLPICATAASLMSVVLASIALAPTASQAMPRASFPSASSPPLVLVSGGCGPYRHRGFYGYCRLNLVRPYGPPGFYRPFRFYRPFMFIRRPFFRFRP